MYATMEKRRKDIRTFKNTYGGFGCEGHPCEGYATSAEAENIRSFRISQNNTTTGLVGQRVEVVNRGGRFFVEEEIQVDYNHPDRIAAGL